MSLCDRCISPGACCKKLRLYRESGEAVTFWLDEPIEEQLSKDELPFKPLDLVVECTDSETGRKYGVFDFMCPKLRPDGRCGDYENRPDLCRRFEPGSGPLCVHYQAEPAL